MVKLSPRLETIAALVPPGARLADVGTDHGLLPICLLQKGVISSAVASDIREGPLENARKNAAAYGVTMRCVLCPGLEGISPDDADVIVIAGMGGELIASILSAAPWVKEDKLLLLQPMTHPELLRRALCDMGLGITGEHLVRDRGKLYPVIAARTGAATKLTALEEYVGSIALVGKEPLFGEYLRSFEDRLAVAEGGLAKSNKPGDDARLREIAELRSEINELRKGMKNYVNC